MKIGLPVILRYPVQGPVLVLLWLTGMSLHMQEVFGEEYLTQLQNRHQLTGHTGEVYKVAFVPGSKNLLVSVGYKDNTVRLWDIGKREQLDMIEYDSRCSWPRDFVFTPDGKKVYVLHNCGSINAYPVDKDRFGERERFWGESIGSHGSLAINRKGTFFASASQTRPVTVTNIEKYREYHPYLGTEDYHAVEFSASESIFAATDSGNTLAFWDFLAQEGFGKKQTYEIRDIAPTIGTWALAFSKDGRQLASGHVDGIVTLWEVDGIQAEQKRSFILPESAFTPVFNPSGTLLAASSQDGSVYLWDTQTGKQVKSYTGDAGSLLSLDIHPDGTKIVAGSLEGPLVLWE